MQKTVLSWYKEYGRSLPWRETRDPYKILVSELMLQQTQVDRVIPKYKTFLEKFPTMQDLAKTEISEVLVIWSGLGYNRRALYLHNAAKEIIEKFNGQFPTEIKELTSIKGIGNYTSSAVLSFAFNQNITVVDVNIEVLMKRIFFGSKLTPKQLATKVLPKGKSRDWHNALMDIGALFCTARFPKCEICPLSKECKSANNQEKIEATWKKKKIKKFKDSDRIVRGTILKELVKKKQLDLNSISNLLSNKKIDRNQEDIQRILEKLEKDKLISIQNHLINLP
jgi:A/G-specific adenine glycosylase